MQLGIVGLPNVGKSTLFNALTSCRAEAANYPFCTIDPNVGVVEVPDPRLYKIAEVVHSKKITPTVVQFVDIAGLVKGASKGEGLGNRFLSHIRQVDAIAHIVRCFEDSQVTHVEGTVDPIRDIETIQTELILADLETLGRRREGLRKQAKSGNKAYLQEVEVLDKVEEGFNEGKPLRAVSLTEEERELISGVNFLTGKATLYVANVGEEDLKTGNRQVAEVEKYAQSEGAGVVVIAAQIEAEIATLDPEERKEFLEEAGLKESGLNRLIREGYALLDLITYFTAGENESRAWTVRRGTNAQKAAGKIHTDMERGFIRAEVTAYDDLIETGSFAAAREKGAFRLEGKDYIIQDGDIVYYRFNV